MLKKYLFFQLFLTPKYQKENPNDTELIAKLKACLEEQVHNYITILPYIICPMCVSYRLHCVVRDWTFTAAGSRQACRASTRSLRICTRQCAVMAQLRLTTFINVIIDLCNSSPIYLFLPILSECIFSAATIYRHSDIYHDMKVYCDMI